MSAEIPWSGTERSPEDLARLQDELDLIAAELLLDTGADRMAAGEGHLDAMFVALRTEFEEARRRFAPRVEDVTPRWETAALIRAYGLEVGANLQVAVDMVGRERFDHYLTDWLTNRVRLYLTRAEVAAGLSAVTLALLHLANTSAAVG